MKNAKTREVSPPKVDALDRYLQASESINLEVQANVRKYGAPFLSSGYGSLHRERMVERLTHLLYEELPDQLVEINIRPEDADGHHWQLDYHILAHDGYGGLVWAIDKERKA